MNDNYYYLKIIVVVIGFIIGYSLLSFGIKKITFYLKTKKEKETEKNRENKQDSEKKGEKYSGKSKEEKTYSNENDGRQNNYHHKSQIDLEKEYLIILGLKYGANPDDIKKGYRNLMSKYHPDKVNHLGVEFQKIAVEKAKKINEAYSFFQRKYNL